MSAFVVRPASSADVAAIDALVRARPFTAKWSAQALRDELARVDSIFLVAEQGGVRGYALARLPAEEAHLFDFAAAEDGKGIGRALWRGMLRVVKSRGAKRLTFEVSENNARARLFYSADGAKVVGRREKRSEERRVGKEC